MVVGVLVAFAMAQFFCAFVVSVFEVLRDGQGAAAADVFERGVDGEVGAVAFVGGGDVDGGFGNRDARFGPTDEFSSLMGGHGEDEGHGIGEADVFGGADEHASGDEAWVFTGMNHFGEPIEGGVGIAAPHGFDEGGNGVVMGVFIAVVNDGFFLDALFGDTERDVDRTVSSGRSGERGNFEGVEGLAGVAIGNSRQMTERVVVGFDFHEAEAAFFVAQGAVEKF